MIAVVAGLLTALDHAHFWAISIAFMKLAVD